VAFFFFAPSFLFGQPLLDDFQMVQAMLMGLRDHP
jgi:hypothetical protein